MTTLIKNGTNIIIDPNSERYTWWIRYFIAWEIETFKVFDIYLKPNQNFIDIGAWVGTTSLYGGYKSDKVFSIEPDPNSLIDFKKNIKINNLDNKILICEQPIAGTVKEVIFGPNDYIGCGTWNESISYIKNKKSNNLDIVFTTITFKEFIKKYNIDNVSLIKIDIEGGEEDIIEDIFQEAENLKNPSIYLSFHLDWWKDKNINRFEKHWNKYKYNYYQLKLIQNTEIANIIIQNPFESILFSDIPI